MTHTWLDVVQEIFWQLFMLACAALAFLPHHHNRSGK